jgi:tRNA (guanine-N7-)-methyltransferase
MLTTPSWAAVFGNHRRVEVEIGPGRGETLLAAAAAAPATNFFGIEQTTGIAGALTTAAAERGLDNVRVIAADARCVIARLVPDASVAAYHIYFPDPWPKTRHHRRRLVTREFAQHVVRTLVPGGTLHLATDVRLLLEAYAAHLVHAGLACATAAVPPRRPVTAFERRYAGEGTYYACFARARAAS